MQIFKNPIVNGEKRELCFKSADELFLLLPRPPPQLFAILGGLFTALGDEQSQLFRARK